MKALLLTATAAIAASAAAPAAASIISLGSSHARSCYLAADAGLPSAEAFDECDAALQVQPLTDRDRLATHVNRGILRMISRDFGRAEADFNQALAINPGQADALLNMGILKYNQGDSAGALQMFARAIQNGTQDPALAYYGRGLANEDRGNLKAAYADLSRARAMRPDWPAPARELQRYQVR